MRNINQIRRAVAILANKINRTIKNLSRSFKAAWAFIKGKTITTKLSGVTFGVAPKALHRLTQYEPDDVDVTLVREPDNAHDEHAVAVHVGVNGSATVKIGYIPRQLSRFIAILLDAKISPGVTFLGVTGRREPYHNYGALVDISF